MPTTSYMAEKYGEWQHFNSLVVGSVQGLRPIVADLSAYWIVNSVV